MQTAPPTLQIRVSLVDEVADVLRRRIYEGVYAPGSSLRQEPIAAEFQISRTPLREALRILEREGLIVTLPRRGARVVTGDRQAMLAAYEMREVIDGLAARLSAHLVATDRAPALVARLEEEIERQSESLRPWDAAAYTEENVLFHDLIYQGSGNESVLAQRGLIAMTSRVFTPTQWIDPERAETAVGEHADIVAAITAGAQEQAEKLAREHIRRTRTALAESYQGNN